MSFIFKYRVKQEKETNIEKETNTEKETLVKKSSCCGAITDAWVPSYPSLMLAPSLESLSEVSSSLDSK